MVSLYNNREVNKISIDQRVFFYHSKKEPVPPFFLIFWLQNTKTNLRRQVGCLRRLGCNKKASKQASKKERRKEGRDEEKKEGRKKNHRIRGIIIVFVVLGCRDKKGGIICFFPISKGQG